MGLSHFRVGVERGMSLRERAGGGKGGECLVMQVCLRSLFVFCLFRSFCGGGTTVSYPEWGQVKFSMLHCKYRMESTAPGTETHSTGLAECNDSEMKRLMECIELYSVPYCVG